MIIDKREGTHSLQGYQLLKQRGRRSEYWPKEVSQRARVGEWLNGLGEGSGSFGLIICGKGLRNICLSIRVIVIMERKKSTIEDYQVTHLLGKGAFGEVMAVRKGDSAPMAMKKVRKDILSKANKLYQPYIEKEVLTKLQHRGIVRLYDTFADAENIYFIMELCPNGDIEELIDWGKLKEDTKRNFAAEIVLVLEYLKTAGVVHRDFKSANILLAQDGHIRLSDFGTAYAPEQFLGTELFQKINQIKYANNEELNKLEEGARRATFVGTPLYMSPQLLNEAVCDYAADLWGFGCLLFEMYFGCPPFDDEDEYTVFKKIQEVEVEIPANVVVEDNVKELILRLLTKDRKSRLGCGEGGFSDIKKHPYFKEIRWEGLFVEPTPHFDEIHEWKQSKQAAKLKQKATTYLLSGVVGKKMLLGNWKQRQMALTAEPKLIYFDESSGQKKGEIQLDIHTPIELDGNKFTITGKKKKYYFKSKKEEHGRSAAEWVQALKGAVSGKAFS